MYFFDKQLNVNKKLIKELNKVLGVSNTTSLHINSCFGISKSAKVLKVLNLCTNLGFSFENKFLELIELRLKYKLGAICRYYNKVSLNNLLALRVYKSLRHLQGLPVRGQRTKNNARTQKSKNPNRKFLAKKK